MTLIVDRTNRIKVGTGVINYYSRTPAALAQHFGTLDVLSRGRMIIGLGASSANVVEHFHGVPFNPTLARMRETVDIINMLIANQPLNYKGKWFDLQRGFTLAFTPFRDHIPIYLASFRPRAVKVVAEIGDGWMPRMIPIEHMRRQVDAFLGHAAARGRDPAAITVVSSRTVTVTDDKESAVLAAKANVAFYIARMGDYYYEQLRDMGFADEVNAVRRAWDEGGSKAGYAAVSDDLAKAVDACGSVEECRDYLQEQEAAGINLHRVNVRGAESPAEEARIYEALQR
jgi:alkanesulfonate monooxygenase SsuD/methylene tetrahydromethanopterin reductase-like flavin-dependent oxidoreductase (luciferase family)